MPKTVFTVRQSTDGVDIDEVVSGWYDEPKIEVTDIPRFQFTLPNDSGINAHIFPVGKEVEIRRGGTSPFPGVVSTSTPETWAHGNIITVKGVHKGYALLQARLCDSYDFDEDGDPATTRDGVTVNPWRYFVMRVRGGALDDNGLEPPVDGVEANDIVESLVGTKFVYQHEFVDNSHLLASQVSDPDAGLAVYTDGASGDDTPALQLLRNGSVTRGAVIDAWDTDDAVLTKEYDYSGEDSIGSGVYIRSDGLRMYLSGSGSGSDIHEYSLSTAWDVSTASHTQTLDVSSKGTANGVFFEDDGSSFFFVDSNEVHEYDMSAAWDISTATFSQTFAVGAQDTNMRDIHFKDDGTKMYLVGAASDRVYEYDLSTAWNISTATFNQNFSVSADTGLPDGLSIDDSGSRMHVVNGTGATDSVLSYTLSTPWNISTASLNQELSVSSTNSAMVGVFWKPEGDRMYLIGFDTEQVVYEYHIGVGGAAEVESIPLRNGDENIDEMGEISDVDVIILADAPDSVVSSDIALEVCRNASESSRTYSPVSLSRTPDYLSSGLDAWKGTLTFSDSPTDKRNLGYKITVGGSREHLASAWVKNAENGTAEGTLEFAISYDGGSTWAQTQISDSGTIHGESVTMTSPDQGVFIVFYVDDTQTVKVARSTDWGGAWTITEVSEVNANSDSPSVDSPSASIVVGAFSESDGSTANVEFVKSKDGGQTWVKSTAQSETSTGTVSIVATGPETYHVAYFRISGGVRTYRYTSTTDGGDTWSTPVTIDTLSGAGDGPQSARSLAAKNSSTLVVSYRDGTDFIIENSTDGGATWGAAATFSAESTTSSEVRYLGSGRFAAVTNSLGTTKVAFSSDNGASWGSLQTTDLTYGQPSFGTGEDTQTFYVFGKNAADDKFTLSKTTDGGSAWSEVIIDSDAQGANDSNFGDATFSKPSGVLRSPKIKYIKIISSTASDTGLSAGTIETYSSPTIDGIDANEKDWIETDLLGMNRLDAMGLLRQLTESDESANPSSHWDIYIDSDLAVNFEERRGATVAKTYSFAEDTLKTISHEYYGDELAFQTVAYGAGSGVAQTRIVSKSEFSAGGLYDSDRDPGDGALYGSRARILQFIDPNESSAVTLLRKARAFHKLHRDPQERVSLEIFAEHIPFFSTGDGITIENLKTRTDGEFRVVDLRRAFSGSHEERITVTLGDDITDFASQIAQSENKTETLVIRPQRRGAAGLGASGNTTFDLTRYGVYPFGIPEGVEVDRVLLKIKSVPTYSKLNSTSSESGTHTHGLVMGLRAFDGDSGDGAGSPVYAVGVRVSVDPADANSDGIPSPTEFDMSSPNIKFGRESFADEVEVDVTAFLSTDSNGVVKPGGHAAFFSAEASGDNASALSTLSITPVFRVRQSS